MPEFIELSKLSELSAEIQRRKNRERDRLRRQRDPERYRERERQRRQRDPERYREQDRRKEAKRRERAQQERERLLETLRVACVNCDKAFKPTSLAPNSMLYCSELCGQEAYYVRYARRTRRDGRARQPDVRDALTIIRAHILSGGYPARERRLSARFKVAIFERDSHRCRVCGTVATEIDHIAGPIDGDINHPNNLQALCRDCHMMKSLASLVPIPAEHQMEASIKELDLENRIGAAVPLRLSDDDENWNSMWKQVAAERRATAI